MKYVKFASTASFYTQFLLTEISDIRGTALAVPTSPDNRNFTVLKTEKKKVTHSH